MQHKYCFEAVNRTLNDIYNTGIGKQFGNIPIVLGGDFAQILPVVRHGNRAAILNACIQRSQLWLNWKKLYLKQNMRVVPNIGNEEFVQFLARISYDPIKHGIFPIPPYMRRTHSLENFCDQVFPPALLNTGHTLFNTFDNRAILSFRNDTVTGFNNLLIQKLQGNIHIYDAINSVDKENSFPGAEHIPAEFLQSLD